MSNVESYEVLIVGGGKAGKTLAADLARAGHRVALVERGLIGGTCINVGCIPTKALVKSAKVAELVARAADFGIRVDRWATEMPAVRAHKRAVVEGMVALNWDNLHGALGEHFILGEARFVAPRTIEVRPADGGPLRRISGDKLFVNLGAEPALPALPGLAEAEPLTSRSALELDRLPEHLVIMGGGFFGNFGSDLRSEKGLFAVLPQLPGNLSSGFIVALGCDGRGDPKLVIGLTDANRARFTTLVAMQAGADATFPHSGLPTYAQQLIDAQFLLSRRGTVQSFTTGAILDTGAPTTTVHEFGDSVIDPALVAGPIVKPATYFSVTADGVGAQGDFALAFLTGQISGVNEVNLTPDTGSYVNLGLIPFFRYDVMFDVERGVVGFAPCHRTSTRRRLPIIESRPAS